MHQSKLTVWFKLFYRLGILGLVALLILLSIVLGIMLIDDLNLASIVIILLVAVLMVVLFHKIH